MTINRYRSQRLDLEPIWTHQDPIHAKSDFFLIFLLYCAWRRLYCARRRLHCVQARNICTKNMYEKSVFPFAFSIPHRCYRLASTICSSRSFLAKSKYASIMFSNSKVVPEALRVPNTGKLIVCSEETR